MSQKKFTTLSDLQSVLLECEKQELKMDENKRTKQLADAKQKAALLSTNKK